MTLNETLSNHDGHIIAMRFQCSDSVCGDKYFNRITLGGYMNKRTKQGYKLRIYIDALHQAKNTSPEKWIQEWISGPSVPYLSQSTWIAYLERCIVTESQTFMRKKAA